MEIIKRMKHIIHENINLLIKYIIPSRRSDKLITPCDVAKIEIIKKLIRSKGITLDIGCGTGRCSIEIAKRGHEIIALDISLEMLKKLKEKINGNKLKNKINLILADARFLPFKKIFDIIIIKDVLEHVIEDQKVLNEAKKVCKERGELIIYVPYNLNENNLSLQYLLMKTLNWSIDSSANHIRRYDKSLKRLISNSGFIIDDMYFFAHFLADFSEFFYILFYLSSFKINKFQSLLLSCLKFFCILDFTLMKSFPGAGIFIIAEKDNFYR
jgi:SAM-dependent methyltransferase